MTVQLNFLKIKEGSIIILSNGIIIKILRLNSENDCCELCQSYQNKTIMLNEDASIPPYHNHCSCLLTVKQINDWQIFNDDVIATAILDRLLHHSHPFLINGPSYRMKDLLPKSKKKQNPK